MTSRHILLGTIVAFGVMVAGFAAGMHFQKRNSASSPLTGISSNEAGGESEQTINNHVYEISPPSLGLMLETYAVAIQPEGYITRVEIPADGPAAIEPGQKVFLYNQNGEMKNSLGTIVNVIRQGAAGTAIAEIDIRNNPDVTLEEIAKGKIIIGRHKDAQRLPFSALVRNDKGETFAWEASENIDGTTTVRYKAVKVTGSNDYMFAIETNFQDSNQFILNPDEKLRDGQKISVRKFLYEPPSQHEEARITALVDARLRQIQGEQDIKSAVENNQQVAGGDTSCAQSPDAAQNFIDKIKMISAEYPPAATSP